MWRTIILPGGDTLKVWDGIYPAEQIDDILTKALRQPGRNLLRNARWDVLANIVNQRGVTGTISTPGYFIDGWKLISGSVTITAAGLVLNGTMVQILEQGLTSSFTASVLRSDGLFPAQYDNATKTFTITGTGQTLIAAKLEAGPNQTLAHQDADGNWVLNDPPPNFRQERAKCRQYYIPPSELLLNGVYVGGSFYAILPIQMRANSTPIIRTAGSIAHDGTVYSVSSVDNVLLTPYGMKFIVHISSESSPPNNSSCIWKSNSIGLNCDL